MRISNIKRQISNIHIKIQKFRFPVIILIFTFCILNFLTGCERKKVEKKFRPMPVEASQVKLDSIQEKLFYVGDIKALEQVKVFPKVTGKVIKNLVKENDKVSKGECLALIDRDEVGFKYESSPVLSPISGVVGQVYLDIGETVFPDTAIAEVVNMDKVRVKVNVVERDLPKIQEGQVCQIKVDAYPEEIFQGLVVSVSPVVDISSRTALVKLEIPNQNYRLKPGMFARIWIVINDLPAVLCIPRDAIIREDSSTFVMVVKNGKVEKRKIGLGLEENNKFEVIEGLQERELVVTLGKERLKDGDLVKIVGELIVD